MAFTDSKIKHIRPGKTRKIVWEDGQTCLGLRVSPQGKKSFVFLYRFEGRARMLTIGRYPLTTLADARIQLAEAKGQLTKGTDPGQLKLTAKAEIKGAPTVSGLIEEYLEKYAKVKKRSWKEDKRMLEKDVLPVWGKRKARDIKKRDVILLMDRVMARGAPILANRLLAIVGKMYNFAISRDICEANPCFKVERPGKENEKDRTLGEGEVKKFWFGLEKAQMSPVTRLALKMELITCQRQGEIAQAEWEEIDLKTGWWIIPKEKSKNKLPHRVFLTRMAKDIFKEAKEFSGQSRWVFQSPRGDKPITSRSLSQAINKNFKGEKPAFKMPRFTPHDLRRTGASQMASMGVPRLTIGKILNHSETGVTAVYDRHTYDKEKRQALEKWARKLNVILTGEKAKVVNLQRK